MTKQEYIQAIDNLIEEAEKDNNLCLMSILHTVCGAILSDSLYSLSNHTLKYANEQIKLMLQHPNVFR